jgi:hypothetical protein
MITTWCSAALCMVMTRTLSYSCQTFVNRAADKLARPAMTLHAVSASCPWFMRAVNSSQCRTRRMASGSFSEGRGTNLPGNSDVLCTCIQCGVLLCTCPMGMTGHAAHAVSPREVLSNFCTAAVPLLEFPAGSDSPSVLLLFFPPLGNKGMTA